MFWEAVVEAMGSICETQESQLQNQMPTLFPMKICFQSSVPTINILLASEKDKTSQVAFSTHLCIAVFPMHDCREQLNWHRLLMAAFIPKCCSTAWYWGDVMDSGGTADGSSSIHSVSVRNGICSGIQ